MSNDNGSWTDRRKEEVIDAAKRVGATQLTNGVQAALLQIFKKTAGLDDAEESTLKKILESKAGHALISVALGEFIDLNLLPEYTGRDIVQDMGKEFRTSGMATMGNEVMDVAMQFIAPAIKDALSTLNKAEKQVEAIQNKDPKAFLEAIKPEVEVNLEEMIEETANQQQAAAR
jgi:hypothetical protein